MVDSYFRNMLSKIILLLISISIGILLGEFGVRTLYPSSHHYFVHKPYLRITFKPSSDIMPGIEGESRYKVNALGVRGDEFSSDQTYRILALGGSSTECHYLDQLETWTGLLQSKLNEYTSGHKIWVGNIGKGGTNTRHHILQMKYLLKQYQHINAIIVLAGINDLSLRLAEDTFYDPLFTKNPGWEVKLSVGAFSVLPVGCNISLPYVKRSALWHLARKCKYRLFAHGQIQDIEGRYMTKWREHRKDAIAIRNVLPDIKSALEEYSRNIETIIDIAESRSVRLIFMTQPVMWERDLPLKLKRLLWFGGIGTYHQESEREYYSVEALDTGMRMYNDILLKTCQLRQIECIDLYSILPKDTTVFYDDCHFNENGAEAVAEIIARYLTPSLQ